MKARLLGTMGRTTWPSRQRARRRARARTRGRPGTSNGTGSRDPEARSRVSGAPAMENAEHHKGKENPVMGFAVKVPLNRVFYESKPTTSFTALLCLLREYPYPHITCKTQRSSRTSSQYLDTTATCPLSLYAAAVDTNTTTRPAIVQCYSICSIHLVACFALPTPLKQPPSCLPLFPTLPTLWALSAPLEGKALLWKMFLSLGREADSRCHKMCQWGSCRLQVSEGGAMRWYRRLQPKRCCLHWGMNSPRNRFQPHNGIKRDNRNKVRVEQDKEPPP